jgi:TM2 domain-containing membrane protein YozV
VDSGAAFCPSCGAPTGGQPNNGQSGGPQYNGGPTYNSQYTYQQPMYAAAPQKSTGIAIVLAFLVPGLGHLYIGKITRGIAIMAIGIVFGLLSSIIVFAYMESNYYYYYDDLAGLLAFIIVLSVVDFIIWIWNLYDVNKLTNEYNAQVRNTGNPPW